MVLKFFKKQFLSPLSILIICGAILRSYKLSFQSYWVDEALTVMNVLRNDFFYFLKTGFGSGDPPLYGLILYFWVKLFGHNEFSTRMLSVLFGIASLPLMYLTARNFFDKRTAVLSTILLTFSAYHVYYAQEATMYSLFWFFAISSILFFIRTIKGDSKIDWMVYLILSICALYTHYSFLFLWLSQNIFVFIFWKEYSIKLKHWIAMQSAIIIFFLPWTLVTVVFYLIAPAFIKKTSYLWIHPLSYADVFKTFMFFSWGPPWVIEPYVNKCLFFCRIFLFLISIVIFLSIYATFKQKKFFQDKRSLFFMLLSYFLPIIALSLVSIYIRPIFTVRYASMAFPPFCILIAYGLDKIRVKFLKIFILASFLIPNIFALNYYYSFPVRGEARGIVEYIKSENTIPDTILIYDVMGGTPAFKYYYPDIRYINGLNPKSLKEIMEREDSFWFFMPSHYTEAPLEILKNKGGKRNFSDMYDLSKKVEFKTTRGFLFKKKRCIL